MLKRAVLSCFHGGQGLGFAAFSVLFVFAGDQDRGFRERRNLEGTWNNPDFSLGRSPDLLVSQQTVVHLVPSL